jgi:hypothetical protein
MEDCVRGVARTVPRRTPSQLRQLQFHCGKPPPAAEPRTLSMVMMQIQRVGRIEQEVGQGIALMHAHSEPKKNPP